MTVLVEYEFRDGAAWITLNTPDTGNAISPDSVAELFAAVQRGEREADVIVLRAVGRFFSVGGDIGGFSQADDMARYIDDLADDLHRVVSEIVRSRAIVVSVVQGPAAGAGFPLAAAADLVIAAESANFTLAYTKLGLANDGGSSLLVHSLGLHRTLRLALLNDTLSAHEALEAGLVSRVVADDNLASTTDKVVATLTSGSATAFARAKQNIRTAADAHPETTLRLETLGMRETADTPDGREGVSAFAEKRKPNFE